MHPIEIHCSEHHRGKCPPISVLIGRENKLLYMNRKVSCRRIVPERRKERRPSPSLTVFASLTAVMFLFFDDHEVDKSRLITGAFFGKVAIGQIAHKHPRLCISDQLCLYRCAAA